MAVSDSELSLTKDDLYLMGQGSWYRSYEKMGAHPATRDGVDGYHFSVWAPDVRSVRVIGDFNDWDIEANFLEHTPTGGVWEGFIPGVTEGQLYKYVIETGRGAVAGICSTRRIPMRSTPSAPREPRPGPRALMATSGGIPSTSRHVRLVT